MVVVVAVVAAVVSVNVCTLDTRRDEALVSGASLHCSLGQHHRHHHHLQHLHLHRTTRDRQHHARAPPTMSTPSSPLSPYSSPSPPPPKRRASTAFSSPHSSDHEHPDLLSSDVSSDTSGSVPGSPGPADTHDDDGPAEQVSVCRWDGCLADMGNMDDLVKHIHEEHIGTRKATYACMWDDCMRKGITHASGYALRAHMRSHTKEKPFYCSLPGRLLRYNAGWGEERRALMRRRAARVR